MFSNEFDKPEEPTQDDCCQNGCNPCVFDIYRAQLKLWEQKKKVNSSAKRFDLLSQIHFKPFILKNVRALTFNTNLYTFEAVIEDKVDNITGVLQYKAGQHLILRSSSNSENSKFLTRAYTIVSNNSDEMNCSFQVLIKLYKGGVMSNYIKTIQQGEIAYWRGPYGDYIYEANKYRNILMICIGTGIAPMYAIIQEILNNEDDETVVTLMFGCRSPSDIILREELYKFGSYWNFNYSCFLSQSYSLNEKKFSEQFIEGKISKQYIISSLKFPVESLQILICGSTTFATEISDILMDCEVPNSNIHIF